MSRRARKNGGCSTQKWVNKAMQHPQLPRLQVDMTRRQEKTMVQSPSTQKPRDVLSESLQIMTVPAVHFGIAVSILSTPTLVRTIIICRTIRPSCIRQSKVCSKHLPAIPRRYSHILSLLIIISCSHCLTDCCRAEFGRVNGCKVYNVCRPTSIPSPSPTRKSQCGVYWHRSQNHRNPNACTNDANLPDDPSKLYGTVQGKLIYTSCMRSRRCILIIHMWSLFHS